MAEPIESVIYAEAQRGLALQPVLLNELRARTGILFAVANGVTGVLGALVIRRDGVDCLATWALALFAASALLCLVILLPLWRWPMSESPRKLITNYINTPRQGDTRWTTEQAKLDLALHMEKHASAMRSNMKWLQWMFVAALACLGAELVLWLVALRS